MKQFNNKRAFSLIEVAIAIALLALALGAVVAVFTQGAVAARKTQQQTVAYSLARAVLEEYSDWVGLTTLTGNNPPTNGTYPNLLVPMPAPILLNDITYIPRLAISDGPINPAQLTRLEVTISWTDGATPRNVTITTLKANY